MALTNAERQKAWRDRRNSLAKQAEALSDSSLRNDEAGHKEAASGQLTELLDAAGDEAREDFASWFLFKHSELLKKAKELAGERAAKLGAKLAEKIDDERIEELAETLGDLVEEEIGLDPDAIKEGGGVRSVIDVLAYRINPYPLAQAILDNKEARDAALAARITEYELKDAVADKICSRVTKSAVELVRERISG